MFWFQIRTFILNNVHRKCNIAVWSIALCNSCTTVNLEIFVVKIFSQSIVATKILRKLACTINDNTVRDRSYENFLTRKFIIRKFLCMKISRSMVYHEEYNPYTHSTADLYYTTNQTLGGVFPTTTTMLFYAAGVYCHTPQVCMSFLEYIGFVLVVYPLKCGFIIVQTAIQGDCLQYREHHRAMNVTLLHEVIRTFFSSLVCWLTCYTLKR